MWTHTAGPKRGNIYWTPNHYAYVHEDPLIPIDTLAQVIGEINNPNASHQNSTFRPWSDNSSSTNTTVFRPWLETEQNGTRSNCTGMTLSDAGGTKAIKMNSFMKI